MVKVSEGDVSISVPKQPVTRKAEAFYNPEMEYQRDLTVSALRVFQKSAKRKLSVCDPLAGTGIRSIRTAMEVPGIERIVVNDSSGKAFRVMVKNVEESGIKDIADVVMENRDATRLLMEPESRFDFIDIDPFGSPVNFLPYAARALRKGSLLACTATDTGALCGSFPSTCLQRYGIKVMKTDFFKETGIRVLVTSVMMMLSRNDMAFVPLYSHANHYFRVIGLVERKKSLLSSQFRRVSMVSYCPSCLFRSVGIVSPCPVCGKKTSHMGPLWTGPIVDGKFCLKMLKDLKGRGYGKTGELETAASEIGEPFYYDLHRLFRANRKTPKKTDEIFRSIRSSGYNASRTHLCHTGMITDAPLQKILLAL